MEESVTYQAIVEEGKFEAVRDSIRRLGQRKFKSPPPAHVQATLDNIPDLEQLRCLLERILDVGSWDELLAPRAPETLPTRK